MPSNLSGEVAERHISWSLLVFLLLVAVHKHLFNVYLRFMMTLWDSSHACVSQRKDTFAIFFFFLLIYYRGLGKFVTMKGLPKYFLPCAWRENCTVPVGLKFVKPLWKQATVGDSRLLTLLSSHCCFNKPNCRTNGAVETVNLKFATDRLDALYVWHPPCGRCSEHHIRPKPVLMLTQTKGRSSSDFT